MILLRISNSFLCVGCSEIPNIHQTSVRYFSKTDRIKRLMVEMKGIFGNLLETSQQKKRRLKLEKKGKIRQQKQNKINTELSWVMKQSFNNPKKISLKILSPAKQQSEHEDTSQTNLTNSSEMLKDKRLSNEDDKNILHVKSSRHTQKIIFKTTSQSKLIENTKITSETTDQSKPIENNKITSEAISQSKPIENNDSLNMLLSDSKETDVEDTVIKCGASERIFDIVVKNIQSFSIMGNKREFSVESTEASSVPAKLDWSTLKFPSVTKILTHTMSSESKLALEVWKKNMIKKLGQEGFDNYQKALLSDGISLHTCIAHSLLGKKYEIPPRIEPVFKSAQSVLKNVYDVKAIETRVAHTKLCYKGIVDCVASYRGENHVIEWKRSDKKKLDLKKTYDAPIQVAAYIGAINASNLYPFVIKRGLIVISYTSGDLATVYELCDDTLQEYWTMWLRRLQQYHVETACNDNMNNKTLM